MMMDCCVEVAVAVATIVAVAAIMLHGDFNLPSGASIPGVCFMYRADPGVLSPMLLAGGLQSALQQHQHRAHVSIKMSIL